MPTSGKFKGLYICTDGQTYVSTDERSDIHTYVCYVEVTCDRKFVHQTGFFPENMRICMFHENKNKYFTYMNTSIYMLL
jgi:hypothetical protein